jgi:uncharacterized protein with HEPN domain
MHPEIKILLKDIELSIKEIHDFLPQDITYKEFQSDIKTRKAIERNLEIIGEAMRRIKELNSDFIVTDSRKIIDTRNRIIHGYDSVSADVIWLIITLDLPVLEKEISELLKTE